MIPAAILLVIAAAGFDAAMHVPIEQAFVVFVVLPLGCLWFLRALVRSSQSEPRLARPVRGVVVHRPAVYRIPQQEPPTIHGTRLRALHGGRDEAAS